MNAKLLFSLLVSFLLFLPLHSEEKKKICLNMIVKNEKAVITRCLNSVKPIIDYWVIVDTGSTDGTQEIIKEYMKDIPGELHERPWKNFEHNRNEALDLAQGKADYCLIMDADDILEFDPEFKLPNLTADGYRMSIVLGQFSFYRPQLIRMEKKWRWKGVLHECLDCPPPSTIVTLEHVRYKDTREGARSQDPQKYAKDALVFEEALKTDPNNSRYMFYLAQSYRDAVEYQKAIDCYETRVAMGGSEEEIYYSMLQIAQLKEILKKPSDIVIGDYFRAYRFRPHRGEALYHLCDYLNQRQDFAISYSLLKSHNFIKQPVNPDHLFQEKWIDNWGIQFQLSICSYHIGKYQESFDLSEALLKRSDLFPIYRSQIILNKSFAENKLLENAYLSTFAK